MFYPDAFYYSDFISNVVYQDYPTGNLSIPQLIQGKPCWIAQGLTANPKPKHLILADWSATIWSSEKTEKVHRAIAKLLNEGFSIFIWQSGEIKRLTLETLSCLTESDSREAMTPAHPQEIAEAAAVQHNLDYDKIQILDYHWIRHVIGESVGPVTHAFSGTDFLQMERMSNGKIFDLVNQSNPALTTIIFDSFCSKSFQNLYQLRYLFPHANIVQQYRFVALNTEQIKALVNGNIICRDGFTLQLHQLSEVRELELDHCELSDYELQTLLKAAPNLTQLSVSQTIIKKDTTHGTENTNNGAENFKKIQGIDLNYCSAPVLDLEEFLLRLPQVKKAYLAGVYAGGDLTHISARLESIEELNLSENAITMVSLPHLLSIPALKKLYLNDCPNLSGDFNYLSPRPSNIEELSLDCGQISLATLQAILSTTPNLKKLYIHNCTHLTDDLVLIAGSLPKLVELYCGKSRLTNETIQALKLASPQLNVLKQSEEARDSSPKPVHIASHNPTLFKSYIPNQDNNPSFRYPAIYMTKNQGVIIDKFSRFLTLTNQYQGLISIIKNGICNALSHFFIACSLQDWAYFENTILKWDGQITTLTPAISKVFIFLYRAICTYQFGTRPVYSWKFLGDNLEEFLRTCTGPCVLENPWHAIAIKPNPPANSWIFYDPNHSDGPHEITRENLLATIHQAIGPLVAVDSTQAIPQPTIADPDSFLQSGGLLVLLRYPNAAEILKNISPGHLFTRQALEGILFRNLIGTPAWVSGITNTRTAQFTLNVLQQFIAQNPNEYQSQLQASLAVLNPMNKKILIESLHATSQNQTFNNMLEKLIRTTPSTYHFEQQLQTWRKKNSQTDDLAQYCHHCIQPGIENKRLIELNSTNDVTAMHLALYDACKLANRPIFYINSPEDLKCNAPFIKRNGNHGLISKGPGGPIYDFLLTHNDPANPPVLIINYDHFSANDRVRFNSLLDTKRNAEGTALPTHAVVIGLANTNKPDCYKGSDFYSRFDVIEKCLVPSARLEQTLPKLPLIPSSNTSNTIELYHSADWKERLLGRWVIDGDALIFEEGSLAKALRLNHTIDIHNGLWEEESFLLFWQLALHRGYIEHQGQTILIPKDLKLVPHQGYDWTSLNALVTCETNISPQGEVLNPSRLGEFFTQYQCDKQTSSLVKHKGIIESHAGGTLHVNITRSLSKSECAMFFTACKEHQVTPVIHRLTTFQPECLLPNWQTTNLPTTVIASTEPDTTLAMLTNTSKWDVIIDVSECKPSDLLQSIDGKLDNEALRFVFKHSTGALVHALEAGQHIVLKGHFTNELADALNHFLFKRQQAEHPLGQLVLLPDNPTSLYGVPMHSHTVTAEEKYACLGEPNALLLTQLIPFEHEPLCKLKARFDFLSTQENRPDSNDTWLGLHYLPPTSSQPQDESTQTFRNRRLKAVNDVLAYAPYVFLTGLTGVGKSTFVENELSLPGDTPPYIGEQRMKDWATDKSPGRKILFIDEANLTTCHWSQFEGLFHTPPGILIGDTYYPLSPEHKVVFAGNPLNYGEGRQLPSFFERHGNTVVFDPIPPSVIAEQILSPVFEESPLKDHAALINAQLLNVYRFLCACSNKEVLISPRELQMMALMVVSYYQQGHHSILDITKQVAWNLAKHLVPLAEREAFDRDFKPMNPLPFRPLRSSIEFITTPSRQPIQQQLIDLLTLRETRRQLKHQGLGNDAQLYGGLGGMVLEGEPGAGKSQLVVATLHSLGYHEGRLSNKRFYQIPASMPLTEKEALLIKAFHQGAVVVMDEINGSDRIERLLNNLLMGKTLDNQRPQHPGFMLIGTQNPVTMAGRRSPSNALQRRLITVEIPPYPASDMQTILMTRGVPFTEAKALVLAYEKQRLYAKRERLTPEPTFRDLLRVGDEVAAVSRVVVEQTNNRTGKISAMDRLNLFTTNPFAPKLKVQQRFDTTREISALSFCVR